MNKLKICILDTDTMGSDTDLSVFQRYGECSFYPLSEPETLKERIRDKDVLITNKVKLTKNVLEGAESLKLICVFATGYDNVDREYCKERGIALCNVAGYSTDSVAQLTLAMVLSASVSLPVYKKAVDDGTYSAQSAQNILTPVYHELAGRTWGIVGYGAIGKKVASVAKALGCRVVVHKRTAVEDAECVSLDRLLEISDVVSLHVPLSDSTRGMIGKRELELMKDGAFLVNVARGAVTDEAAVRDAVLSGKLGFFGCDVYSAEPMTESHPFYILRGRDNVCLTPHMAWGAAEARQRCADEICKNIEAFLSGEQRNRII